MYFVDAVYIFLLFCCWDDLLFDLQNTAKNTALIQNLQYHGMNVNNVIAGIIIDF